MSSLSRRKMEMAFDCWSAVFLKNEDQTFSDFETQDETKVCKIMRKYNLKDECNVWQIVYWVLDTMFFLNFQRHQKLKT